MKNFVNLTPHAINVETSNGVIIAIPSAGSCRISSTSEQVGEFDSIPVNRTVYGEVQGLPEPQENTVYIVSLPVLQALAGKRHDVVAPDTGATAIRENGQIKAVRGFIIV